MTETKACNSSSEMDIATQVDRRGNHEKLNQKIRYNVLDLNEISIATQKSGL